PAWVGGGARPPPPPVPAPGARRARVVYARRRFTHVPGVVGVAVSVAALSHDPLSVLGDSHGPVPGAGDQPGASPGAARAARQSERSALSAGPAGAPRLPAGPHSVVDVAVRRGARGPSPQRQPARPGRSHTAAHRPNGAGRPGLQRVPDARPRPLLPPLPGGQ